ncbi:DUF302 domain-containing protein [Aliiroseovarius sp. KMU-50]|uniref:DUF302 domain-containing protein n=1 Tax=Aliiroseovarius salicola TaxID=3009082 RepID=A0ABT4W209_9RHOB|nr:DUF302 domain-containing protein [Aliiroseovarius sp. KMU-50]MDA5094535.1 DUF302 domain-containing protein [Aliiroseovarius sp. KMU-50]
MRKILTVAAAGLCLALPVFADSHGKMDHGGSITYKFDGDFDDATFAVESAIVGAGLKIDYISYVGDMLERTGKDVGSDVKLYDNANIFIFCSAVLSRKVMEVDPSNLAYCPYGIFVSDHEGAVEVGYRTFPEGEMQEVQALLDGIVQEAVSE